MIATETNHDVAGTFIRVSLQPLRRFFRRTTEASLEFTERCCRYVVVTLKKAIEPVIGFRGVVVD